jgi:dihydrofolate reductase
MAKIKAFLFLSINGYYKGLNEDISWHQHDEEGAAFSQQQLSAGNILLFGRKTYDMMSNFWPSKMAAEVYPEVAQQMNAATKIVISNSLKKVSWKNTSIINGKIVQEIKNLKANSSVDITILGSGSIVTLLSNELLIDEYEFMIDPVALAEGVSLFQKMQSDLHLKLVSQQVFPKSGCLLLKYEPVRK